LRKAAERNANADFADLMWFGGMRVMDLCQNRL